jgi:AcrR family transcriptional regulator
MKKKIPIKKKIPKSHKEMSLETSRSLLTAAREAFFANGFHGTSMDALCAQVGLTRGALYHHFGSKEGLLEAVIIELDRELGEAIATEWSRYSDPWEALLAACEFSLRAALDPLVKKLYHQEGRLVLGERVREIDASGSIKPITEILQGLMNEKKIKSVDAETLARQINAMLMESAIFISESEDPSIKLSLSVASFRMLMYGMRIKGKDGI